MLVYGVGVVAKHNVISTLKCKKKAVQKLSFGQLFFESTIAQIIVLFNA